MSAVLDAFVPALALSAFACACLALLRSAPPRVRFAIAITGLCAWLVPWAWISIPLPVADAFVAPWREPAAGLGIAGAVAADASHPLVPFAVAAMFIVGAALFARDCLALRRCVRRWRAASQPGDALRALLPPDLRAVAAEIRIVKRSGAAAASGLLRPTIWIGDRYTGTSQKLVLTHEMSHVRQRDPAWLAAIAAVRRAYWWNPLVAYLTRQAVLMLEASCDHRCADALGKQRYIAELAALLLDGASAPASPQLLATARSASFNVARLQLLGARLRLRARDVALIVGLSAAGTVGAAASVIDVVPRGSGDDRSAERGPALPSTPAGRALAALLAAANAGDSEALRDLLGAYTPQEVTLPLPSGGAARVVEVLSSAPLRIEYVVEDRHGSAQVGELAVADSAARQITSARMRELP